MAAGLNYRNYEVEINETEILESYAADYLCHQLETDRESDSRLGTDVISHEHKSEQYSTLIQKCLENYKKRIHSVVLHWKKQRASFMYRKNNESQP